MDKKGVVYCVSNHLATLPVFESTKRISNQEFLDVLDEQSRWPGGVDDHC
jgi:hypothetical protein